MLKDEFYTLCCRYMSTYASDTLCSIYALITDNDLSEIETDLNGLISRHDNIDPAAFPSLLISLVSKNAIDILTSEGVIFNNDFDSTDLNFIYTLLNSHLSINTLDDPGWIRELIENSETDDTRDIYYEIITGISELGTENFYEYISYVTSELIESIRISIELDDEEIIEPTIPVIRDNVFTFIYKNSVDINKFISTYYDLNITYKLQEVINEDYYRNVVIKDIAFSSDTVIMSTFLLCKNNLDIISGIITLTQSDKDDIINIARVYSAANNIDIIKVMSSLSSYYKHIPIPAQMTLPGV